MNKRSSVKGSKQQSTSSTTSAHPLPAQKQQEATKHICDRCHHKHLELMMRQVSLYGDEYRIWTAARATHFRSHHLKYPPLVWLCASCYNTAQQTQGAEE
jgi:hypothetical protein